MHPVRYKATDILCFDCHKGVSCWNACCYDTDIMLTLYDLLRLARHFDARPGDVVRLFGAASVHERSGMPEEPIALKEDVLRDAIAKAQRELGAG